MNNNIDNINKKPVLFGFGIGVFVAMTIYNVFHFVFDIWMQPEKAARRAFGKLARKCGPALRKELTNRIMKEKAKEDVQNLEERLEAAKSILKKFE